MVRFLPVAINATIFTCLVIGAIYTNVTQVLRGIPWKAFHNSVVDFAHTPRRLFTLHKFNANFLYMFQRHLTDFSQLTEFPPLRSGPRASPSLSQTPRYLTPSIRSGSVLMGVALLVLPSLWCCQ